MKVMPVAEWLETERIALEHRGRSGAVAVEAVALEDEGPTEADAWLRCALALQDVHDAVIGSR